MREIQTETERFRWVLAIRVPARASLGLFMRLLADSGMSCRGREMSPVSRLLHD